MCLSGLLFIKTSSQFDSQTANEDNETSKARWQRSRKKQNTTLPADPPYKLTSRVNEQFGAVAHNPVLWSVATFIYTEL